jgi:hypothetical protein
MDGDKGGVEFVSGGDGLKAPGICASLRHLHKPARPVIKDSEARDEWHRAAATSRSSLRPGKQRIETVCRGIRYVSHPNSPRQVLRANSGTEIPEGF